jgi:hypothetical protein
MLLVKLFRIYIIGRRFISNSYARTSYFASKEIANGPSRAKRKHRDRRLGDGDMARTRAHGAGRNPDRGSQPLSP